MLPRWTPVLAALLALIPAMGGAEAAVNPYAVATIDPAKTSIYIGSVSLTMTPLVREGSTYVATYQARVFPFFFYGEQGQLWIDFSDADLVQLARGETVQFTGHARADDGSERRIEGRATRADAMSGKIKVRVFVTKRIELIFNTTYRFGKT